MERLILESKNKKDLARFKKHLEEEYEELNDEEIELENELYFIRIKLRSLRDYKTILMEKIDNTNRYNKNQ